jgi:alkanesulfonate monooxygenase SsuD/methylene tetrahydromethanopterin reductase-like flavin-dependent oxidoreductase (luciferase family)
MSKRIEDLRPEAQQPARDVLSDAKAAGLRPVLGDTARSALEQLAKFAQSRGSEELINAIRAHAGMPKIDSRDVKIHATDVDGKTREGAHQHLDAIDVALLDDAGKSIWCIDSEEDAAKYRELGVIFKKHGFRWGGDFLPLSVFDIGWDPFHGEWQG